VSDEKISHLLLCCVYRPEVNHHSMRGYSRQKEGKPGLFSYISVLKFLDMTQEVKTHGTESCKHLLNESTLSSLHDGFGGLVVRMLASGSRVRGFKPGRKLWIFSV
jgi:hypothetical protein